MNMMQTDMSLTCTIRRTSSTQTFLKTRGLCLRQSWPLTKKKMTAAYQGPYRNWCTKNIFMAFTDFSTKRGKMKRRELKQDNCIRNFNELLTTLLVLAPCCIWKPPLVFHDTLVKIIEWIDTKFWGICLQLTSVVSRHLDYHFIT